MCQGVDQHGGETPFRRGGVTRNGQFKPTHRRATLCEVLRGPVDEGHNRTSKRLAILTLVLLQEARRMSASKSISSNRMRTDLNPCLRCLR